MPPDTDKIYLMLADLRDAFPRQQVSRPTLRIYFEDLKDLPDDALSCALRELRRTSVFFPSIKEIREAAAEYVCQLPSETEALEQVEALVRGNASGVHPLVGSALKIVGGSYLWKVASDPQVLRGQFARAYRDLRSREIRQVQVGNPELPPGRKQLPVS